MGRGLYLHPGRSPPNRVASRLRFLGCQRSHAGNEVPLGRSCNIEPPDRMVCSAARSMQLSAGYLLSFKDLLQPDNICSVLLHKLDVEPCSGTLWNTALRIEVA